MSDVAIPVAPPLPQARRRLISNEVLGMLIFTLTEAMLFSGFISAFMIVKSGATMWPPPGQPRLPFEATAINTTALLISGVLMFFAHRRFKVEPARAKGLMLASILLGAFFVIFQGVEWVALIREGLTLTSSTHGSFFYLLVGAHGFHAVIALLFFGRCYLQLRADRLRPEVFGAVQVFWYFVVGLWPIIYLRVYL